MPLIPGTRLGSYEVLGAIGKGGMGEVYRARDSKLGRDVAIKVLPDSFINDPERLVRFRREAQLLASLNHPGIATLHGLEESEGGGRFLVMELIEGETLAERIARGTIPIEAALALFHQMAQALEAAHQKAVVHRDLKPANIKITPEGNLKILDFGLAKGMATESAPPLLSESPTITRDGTEAGVILGTAPYMSPEQAKGYAVDKRADIWAFGCCLYEALTAKAAFTGDTVSETIARILEREPDWKALPKATPPGVRTLLRRCLRKDASRRLHDIADARIELEDAMTDPTVAPVVVEGAWERRVPRSVLVIAIIAATAAGVAIGYLLHSDAPQPNAVTRSVIPLPPGEELVLDASVSVAISPDGRQVAYVARRADGLWQLYRRALDEPSSQPVERGLGGKLPVFSPDSQWLAFIADAKVMKVSASGGAPVIIGDVSTDARSSMSWGPDGRIIFAASARVGLSEIRESDGVSTELTAPRREEKESTHRFPEILADGNAVLFGILTDEDDSWDDATLAALSLDTGEYHHVLEGGTSPRFSPTGHLVYARAGSLLAVPFDRQALRVTGVPVSIVEGTAMGFGGAAQYSFSETGSLLYARGSVQGREDRLVFVDRSGVPELAMEATGQFAYPRLSPDNHSAAVGVGSGSTRVWIYDLERGTATRLGVGSANWTPIWTPDGRRVAFISNRAGVDAIYWQSVNGTRDAEVLTRWDEDEALWQVPGSWSPDGRTLAFTKNLLETGWDIWTVSVEGDREVEPYLVTPFNEGHPDISPDGSWIAYHSDESGRFEMYVRPFPDSGTRVQVSTDGADQNWPRWHPNGRELFYQNGERMMVVDVDFEDGITVGRPRVLFERRMEWGWDLTPDGQRFLMVEQGESGAAPTELILVQNWFSELERLVPTN